MYELFDFYALGSDFPKQDEPRGTEPDDKAARIESAVDRHIQSEMGRSFDQSRFKCFIVVHEFEALLFSEPSRLAAGIDRLELAASLQAIRDKIPTPEHINDGTDTAPLKQLLNLHRGYDKVVGGSEVARSVGLDAMRRECPHFRGWLEWLGLLA